MQVTEILSEGLKRQLKVVIAAGELDTRLNEKLNDIKDKVRINGFRPGKVPKHHLKKVYGPSIMSDVVQQAVVESSSKAISDRDERPAVQPDIKLPEDQDTVEKIVAGDHDLEYTMTFEVLPKFELADLKTLEVERPVAEVDDKEVDDALGRVRGSNVVYDAKDGEAANGDRVTIDFVGKIDGEPFEGGAAEDAPIILGQGGFIPGFEDGLIGAKAGDERVVKVTFPEKYQAAHLAGKDAEFDVKVKEVAASRLPDADDEFAKSLGLESLDKLKTLLREQISKEFGQASRRQAKQSLFEALAKAHSFELPPSLVESEFTTMWRDLTRRMEMSKKTFEDQDTTEEKVREEYRSEAERKVRLGLVLSEIGRRNEITVQDEEVRRAVLEQARQYPGQERQVVEFYKKNPNAELEIRIPLFEDKVVDFALELVKVTEKTVTPKELFGVGDDHDHDHDHHAHDHDHDHVHDEHCGHDH
jgi:trigger factor